jgi:hypothetical protein
MTLDEQRAIALGAMRAACRKHGLDYRKVPIKQAYGFLDDLAYSQPDLVASKWYLNATDAQYKKLVREWGAQQKAGG